MREFGARFIFHGGKGNRLSDALMYDIRREVSRLLQICEFGASMENGNRGFDNQYAVPSIDQYDPQSDELHISYYWAFPLVPGHGDLWRLNSVGVPDLHIYCENLNVKLTFHTLLV